MSQTAFSKEGLKPYTAGLTREDLTLKTAWEKVKVLCPYCLHYGTLWDFSTRLKQKRAKHYVSMSKCMCPDCGQGYMKRTLLKICKMTMDEYAFWFWDNMFGPWSLGDKVSWDKHRNRLRGHFDYETRQIFWDVYWEFKDAPDKEQVGKDREDFEEYKKERAAYDREDYEDYRKAFQEEGEEEK